MSTNVDIKCPIINKLKVPEYEQTIDQILYQLPTVCINIINDYLIEISTCEIITDNIKKLVVNKTSLTNFGLVNETMNVTSEFSQIWRYYLYYHSDYPYMYNDSQVLVWLNDNKQGYSLGEINDIKNFNLIILDKQFTNVTLLINCPFTKGLIYKRVWTNLRGDDACALIEKKLYRFKKFGDVCKYCVVDLSEYEPYNIDGLFASQWRSYNCTNMINDDNGKKWKSIKLESWPIDTSYSIPINQDRILFSMPGVRIFNSEGGGKIKNVYEFIPSNGTLTELSWGLPDDYNTTYYDPTLKRLFAICKYRILSLAEPFEENEWFVLYDKTHLVPKKELIKEVFKHFKL